MLAAASELVSPLLGAVAGTMTRSHPLSPPAWRRGLIIGHNHLGDVLYRTCSLARLRQALPECRWDYLAHPQSAPILEGNPHIDRVIPSVIGSESWSLDKGAFATLRKERYDVAICTNTIRHHPDLMLAVALGIPARVAFSGRGFSALISHPVPFRHPQPYPAYFRSMVGALAGDSADWSLRPAVYPSDTDRAHAEEAWSDLRLEDGRPVLACTVATRQPGGAWPLEYFEKALRITLEKTSVQLVLCGTDADMPALTQLAEATGGTVLNRRLPILGFAAFLERCDTLFAMDSGPRHLANAVGTPVVFMRNLTFSAVEAGCYCDNESDAAPPVERLDGPALAKAMNEWPASMAAERLIATLANTSDGY